MLTVKLKESDKPPRILSRHPWVYLDQLSTHIKSVQPGFPVKLVDQKSNFLAYGIGNPQSQIAFRSWSFKESEFDFFTKEYLIKKLNQMWQKRYQFGFRDSFRLCFSEGDDLSGVIVDRYLIEGGHSQILVFQLSTSAFEVINPSISGFVQEWLFELQKLFPMVPAFPNTAIIVRRSQPFAEVENLTGKRAVEIIQDAGLDLVASKVLYSRYPYFEPRYQVSFESDFFYGQKTGLFLDQSFNIGLVSSWAQQVFFGSQKRIKILDLCCYRGSWSAHLSHHLNGLGLKCQVHMVDQSERALEQASFNVNPFVEKFRVHKGDVMSILESFCDNNFDIIISDPPAFAKSKKSIGSALEGYYHLNRKALMLSSERCLFVACSCSSVVTHQEFQKVLERALLTQENKRIHFLGAGGQALDHPISPFFSEGEYLKMRGYLIG